MEKLEKRERSTVAEAGTKTGTEKYELQAIGGQKIQIRRLKLQERKEAIMNAASHNWAFPLSLIYIGG